MVGVHGGDPEAVGLRHLLDLDDLWAVLIDWTDVIPSESSLFEEVHRECAGDLGAVQPPSVGEIMGLLRF